MNYPEYLGYVSEASNYPCAAALLAEYGYPADCRLSPDNLVKAFDIIWAVSKGDFAALTGSNRSAFARKFSIPPRSLQNWELGTREAPPYIIQMIGFILITDLIDASEKEDI